MARKEVLRKRRIPWKGCFELAGTFPIFEKKQKNKKKVIHLCKIWSLSPLRFTDRNGGYPANRQYVITPMLHLQHARTHMNKRARSANRVGISVLPFINNRENKRCRKRQRLNLHNTSVKQHDDHILSYITPTNFLRHAAGETIAPILSTVGLKLQSRGCFRYGILSQFHRFTNYSARTGLKDRANVWKILILILMIPPTLFSTPNSSAGNKEAKRGKAGKKTHQE